MNFLEKLLEYLGLNSDIANRSKALRLHILLTAPLLAYYLANSLKNNNLNLDTTNQIENESLILFSYRPQNNIKLKMRAFSTLR